MIVTINADRCDGGKLGVLAEPSTRRLSKSGGILLRLKVPNFDEAIAKTRRQKLRVFGKLD